MTNTAAIAPFTASRIQVSTIIVKLYRVAVSYVEATEMFVSAAAELGYTYGPNSTFTTAKANAIYAKAVSGMVSV